MNLTKEQIASYHENGFLVIENLFSEEDVQVLKSRITSFNSFEDLPNIIREKNGEGIRSVFAPHKHDEIFDILYQDQRVAIPAQQLIEEDLYLYQYKLNLKKAFTGRSWEWHQDFSFWKLDDGVESPDMISAMIYLDDTRSYQGPIMVIPGSHKVDVLDFEEKEHLDTSIENLQNSLGEDLKYSIQKKMIKKLAASAGIKVLEYAAGTCIFFHPNLFHASSSNISPFDRDTVIITYNSVNNRPKVEGNRPDFICLIDYSTIAPKFVASGFSTIESMA